MFHDAWGAHILTMCGGGGAVQNRTAEDRQVQQYEPHFFGARQLDDGADEHERC